MEHMFEQLTLFRKNATNHIPRERIDVLPERLRHVLRIAGHVSAIVLLRSPADDLRKGKACSLEPHSVDPLAYSVQFDENAGRPRAEPVRVALAASS